MTRHSIDTVTNDSLEESPILCVYRDTTLNQPALHSHRGYEFYMCVQGGGSFLAGDRVFALSPGSLVIVRPMVLHLSKPDRRHAFHRFILTVDDPYLNELIRQDEALRSGFGRLLQTEDSLFFPPSIRSVHVLQDNLLRLEKELRNREPYYEASVRSLLLKSLVDMARSDRAAHGPARSEAGLTAKVEQILGHFAERYSEQIQMDEVAARFKLSRSYMYRIFKEHTGYAPNEYLLAFRINQAKSLLMNTKLSVIEISSRSGFRDVSHFCHMFKKWTGTTPSGYRSGSTP